MHAIHGLRDKIENNRSMRRGFFFAIWIPVAVVVSSALTHFMHLSSSFSFVIGFSAGEVAAEIVRRKLGIKARPPGAKPAKPPTRVSVANRAGFAAFLTASPIAYLAHEAGLPAKLAIAFGIVAFLLTAFGIARTQVTFEGHTAGTIALGAVVLFGLLAYTATDHGVRPVAALAAWAVLSLAAVVVIVKLRPGSPRRTRFKP